MKDEPKVGIIHEIGDMGLGFEELSESDSDKLEKLKKEEKESKK